MAVAAAARFRPAIQVLAARVAAQMEQLPLVVVQLVAEHEVPQLRQSPLAVVVTVDPTYPMLKTTILSPVSCVNLHNKRQIQC